MPQDINRDEVRRLQTTGAAIVEVLPRQEFDLEHIAGAVSLPLGELCAASAAQRVGSDTARPIVAYCQSVD